MDRPEITLEVCSNIEWLRENGGLDLEKIEDGMENEAAGYFAGELTRRLEDLDYTVISALGERMLYHGWNGANLFAHKLGPVGTFDALTPEQVEEIMGETAKAAESAEESFKKEVYKHSIPASFTSNFKAALDYFREYGEMMLYDDGEWAVQDMCIWEADFASGGQMCDEYNDAVAAARASTEIALAHGGMTEEEIAKELADWMA